MSPLGFNLPDFGVLADSDIKKVVIELKNLKGTVTRVHLQLKKQTARGLGTAILACVDEL